MDPSDTLLASLASNVTELETLFDYASSVCTQPINTIKTLDGTFNLHSMPMNASVFYSTGRASLRDLADIRASLPSKHAQSVDIRQLQERIDSMRHRLTDDCVVQ